MTWSPSFVVDGTAPGVASVNTLFTGARTTVNALERRALRRGALNVNQAPSAIKGTFIASASATTSHNYDSSLLTMDYTTFGLDGSTDRTPITGASVDIPSLSPGYLLGNNGTDHVQFVLAMFNIDVINITDAATNVDAMICLQFRHSGSATWWTLSKTERWVSRDDHKTSPTSTTEHMWYDLGIRTMIRAETISAVGGNPATDKLEKVRAVCALRRHTAGAILRLGSFNLSAIPLLASLD